jgi:RNA polymerase sigma-70 factor (sigma-E family)
MTTNDGIGDFDGYVGSHGAGLERYAYALTGDAYIAQDLVQTALMKTYRRWRRISRMESPDAYVRRVVTSTFLDHRRRRSTTTERSVAEVPDGSGGPDPAARAVQHDDVLRALTAVTPNQRAVIVLRYFVGLSDGEIATELGCSTATVRSHASRALDRMRTHLSDSDVKEDSW